MDPTSGNALLLSVYDDPTKPASQSKEIQFSRWNGSTWSVPALVTNDLYLNSAPQVAWTNSGTAVAVWQRINNILPISSTWDTTTANETEIATSTYDPASNTWSPVSLLTSNNVLDMSPQLSHNGSGQLLAVWHQNAAGILSGDATHPDRVMAAFYDGHWSTPSVAVSNIAGLVGLAAGYGHGAATIAYTQLVTPTDSLTPTSQLFTSTWDGTSWAVPIQQTNDSQNNTNPQVVYNSTNQPLVVWLGGNVLHLRNLIPGSDITLNLPSAIGSVDEFHVVQDSIGNIATVFVAQAAQRDLYLSYYDQSHNMWGNPVHLTNDTNNESYPTAGLDSSGRLLAAYASTAINSITGV